MTPIGPGSGSKRYGREWQQFRAEVLARWLDQGWPCALCGKRLDPEKRIEVDHIEPVAEATDHADFKERLLSWDNVRAVHTYCHRARTARARREAELGYELGVDAEGNPLDPRHPWHGSKD